MSTSTVTIRPLRLGDLTALHKLFARALRSDFQYYPSSYIKEVEHQNNRRHLAAALFNPNRLILVAVRRREIVGFSFASAHNDGIGHLYWLYVNPDLRGQKVGKRLLQSSLRGLGTRGMSAVELVTYNFDNYYEQQGFWHRGQIRQHSADLQVMQYDLTPSKLTKSTSMPKSRRSKTKVAHRAAHRTRWAFWVALAMIIGAATVLKFYDPKPITALAALINPAPVYQAPIVNQEAKKPAAGDVVQIVSSQHYLAPQVTAAARQNYGAAFPASPHGVTRLLIRYRSTDQTGKLVVVYGQVYIPDSVTRAPVLVMAPGTTGLSPTCSVSLEQPAVHDWANYNSHMMAYASRGFTTVITDYQNMRGTTGPQPYMVGAAEAHAVLDSIRALGHLPVASSVSNLNQIFVAGYSQGGHAAFWADSINKSYAPDVKLAGIIGWGPVLNVETSWQGITAGSTLDWFGPALLTSYANYYSHDYNVTNILQPQFAANLTHDAMAHCIDSDIAFWGIIPAKVYTPQFISDLKTGVLPPARYGDLQQDLSANQVVDNNTTPKLVNQGGRDNVVLPGQQTAAASWLCGGGAPVDLDIYPQDTHYNLMVSSFDNTLAWIQDVAQHRPVTSTCQAG